MGFRKNAIATVWKVEEISPSLTRGQISVSRHNKETDQWEQDFNGFVAFIGTASAAKALRLEEKDKIRLGDVDVSTKYDKDKKVTYTNYKIFSFDGPEELNNKPSNNDSRSEPEKKNEPELEIDDSNLPF